jgi:hypothetical protein
MPTSNVVVQEALGAGTEANWLFVAGGTLMDDTNLAIVTPIVRGSALPGGTGLLSATLLASDNFGTGELLWSCFIRIQGMPYIEVHDFVVNFALGATQTLFTVLKASGWTPIST